MRSEECPRRTGDTLTLPGAPGSKNIARNIIETVAESHQRVLYLVLDSEVCVDSRHLLFHFAAFSLTFPANGRPLDPTSK